MKYYTYDNNGLFISENELQIDPIETKNSGETVYFGEPKNSTLIEPVMPENKIAKWEGDKWEYVEDIRGVYYNTSTGEKVIINILDADTTGLTKEVYSDGKEWDGEKWEYNLDYIKAKKITEIKSKTEQIILGGMDFDTGNDILVPLSTSRDSQFYADVIFSRYLSGGYDGIEGEEITRTDTSEGYMLLKDDIPLYANQMTLLVKNTKASGRLLHTQINACTTIEEVEGIVDSR